MPYAIARIAKLKRGNLAGSASHSARQRYTPNADPSSQNIRFIGSDDPLEKLDALVLAKIDEHKQKRKIRPDAVYCVELLLTASPEYFRPLDPSRSGHYDEQRLKAWLEVNRQWLNQKWGDLIVRGELHLDEATPHIHAYLVPKDEKGQLNCKALFGGREKMRKFQDDYHAAVQRLGLERGIKGSRAQHQDIKDFYQIVNVGRDLDKEVDPELLLAKAADRERALQKRQEMEQTAKSLALKVEQLEATNSKLKTLADQLRDLPLEEVAWHLGLDKDQKNRWKGRNHNINIDGGKFYDFSSSRGGGGSIDLVMHVRQCPYKEALAWLKERFGSEGMLQGVTHHARLEAIFLAQTSLASKFKPPQPEESQWERVRDYLLSSRKLPDYLIDSLHSRGAIYADSSQNAVFLMRTKEREVGGAFLYGTAGGNDNQLMGYADNTLRHSSWFVFQMGKSDGDPVERVVILQSPIDALSFAALDRTQQEKRTLYLVADGRRQLPMDYLFDKEVVVAYSREGDDLAREIKQIVPHARRHRPRGEDWNADLQELYLKEPPQHQQKSKHPSSLELD
ncbi:MAG TPA: MobV family relaxase [Coleofasciculaceae cyanobacterium]|jgi:hypothetical protein